VLDMPGEHVVKVSPVPDQRPIQTLGARDSQLFVEHLDASVQLAVVVAAGLVAALEHLTAASAVAGSSIASTARSKLTVVLLPTWLKLVRTLGDRGDGGAEVVGSGSAAVVVWLPAWISMVR
jgi:hypothetical protein